MQRYKQSSWYNDQLELLPQLRIIEVLKKCAMTFKYSEPLHNGGQSVSNIQYYLLPDQNSGDNVQIYDQDSGTISKP